MSDNAGGNLAEWFARVRGALLGIWLAVVAFASLDAAFASWRVVEHAIDECPASAAGTPAAYCERVMRFGPAQWHLTIGSSLLMLAFVFGVLGSLIHVIRSLATHVAKKTFTKSWTWWYLSRPLLGGLLAVIVMLLLRAGLLNGSQALTGVDPVGIAGLTGLVGIFAEPALKKLGEVANTLFASKTPDITPPTLDGNPTAIAEPIPGAAPGQNAARITFTLTGTGFELGTAVYVNGAPAFAEATEQGIAVTYFGTTADKNLKVRVLNPPPTGLWSNELVIPVAS